MQIYTKALESVYANIYKGIGECLCKYILTHNNESVYAYIYIYKGLGKCLCKYIQRHVRECILTFT